jgi:putative DNA primase/helicase
VNLLRVSSRHPCPICGRPKWCSVSDDGAWAICTKEASERPTRDGVGWLHRLAQSEKRNGHDSVRANGTGPTTRYAVVDANGALAAIHCRRDPPGRDKVIWWEQPDGTKGLGGRKPTELPLYQADLLVEAPPGRVVFVTEGEKAADALVSLGLHAVGTVTGADTIPCDDALRDLIGFNVVLWPDNDAKGRHHMHRIAQRLLALGASEHDTRTLVWPDAPDKGDAADFVAAGLGVEALRTLYGAATASAIGVVAPSPGVVVRRLSDVQAETVHWLWRGRIPFAKLTALDGDPGLGKSTLTLDIAARLTRGDVMPDGSIGDQEGPRSVLLLTAEDGVADTIKPRLAAMGADQDHVFVLDEVAGEDGHGQMPAIPRDLAVIEALVRAHDVGLIVVDPLIAFLGDSSETNTWRDQDIRRALGPCAAMLERTGAALVMVRHLNKGAGGNPIYRGGGSIGIIGAARMGLMVSTDPDDDTRLRRILAMTKANLSAPSKSMAYHMEQAINGSVRIVWEGETEHTAVGLLADPLPEDERDMLAGAIEFLKGELYGEPVETKEIYRRGRESGYSQRSIERARKKLGVVSAKKTGPWGKWCLSLPVKYRTEPAPKADGDA